MKIYFAGNVTVPREKILIRFGINRLFSFYYHGKGKEFEDEFIYHLEEIKNKKLTSHLKDDNGIRKEVF